MVKPIKKKLKLKNKPSSIGGIKAQHPEIERTKIKPGEVRNPKGRPKGSRNKFAEEFLADFLSDWEKNGKSAIKSCRMEDPVAYVKVAASLLPKDFNVNVTDEKDLDRLLEQFDDEQLRVVLAAISAAGTKDKDKTTETTTRAKPGSVH